MIARNFQGKANWQKKTAAQQPFTLFSFPFLIKMYGLKTSSSSSSRRTGSGEKGAAKLALPMFDIRNDQFEIPEFTEEDLMDPELLVCI